MTGTSLTSFLGKFNFNPEKTLYVGIERESFTTVDGIILPLTPKILPLIERENPVSQIFSYELSACQLEMKYGPFRIEDVYNGLISANDELAKIEKKLDFISYFADVAGQEISLEVYPDPTGRYGILASTLTKEVLHAACYVAGTHVHIGMPSAEDALRVYNKVCSHARELISLGDNSRGERIRYYSLMSKELYPAEHLDINSWFLHSRNNNYCEDPRKCWTLIRISVHGTIEFRMFGSTPNLQKVNEWAEKCHNLCKKYL